MSVQWKAPLADTSFGNEEVKAVTRVLESGWVTMGPETKAFESEFASFVGSKYALACSNGTAALHLAYEAAGLSEDDEFCLPALTFVATLNAGLYLRARPVFIDCASAEDLTISPEDLENKITPRTRLIVTMPYGGFVPDMESICRIAEKNGIPVVEDASHAPLAELNGKKLGTFGKAGTFSFFGNKNMTTGEGGMVVTDDDAVMEKVKLLRSHGMTTLSWDRHKGHAGYYDVVTPGYNYRIDDVRSAIGREQLKKLPAITEARIRAAHKLYVRLLPLRDRGLIIPFSEPRGYPVYHLFMAVLPEAIDRDEFRESLARDGVQTSVHYIPLHRFSHARPYLKDHKLPVVEKIEKRLVTLPMGPHLGDEEIEIIGQAVESALA